MSVVGYETGSQRWTMYHLDGGNGFDVYHGPADGNAIAFSDAAGNEALIPGDGDNLDQSGWLRQTR